MSLITDQLLAFLSTHGVQAADLALWGRWISSQPADRAETFFKTIKKTPGYVSMLNTNLKIKYQALQSQNKNTWEKIIGVEEKLLTDAKE